MEVLVDRIADLGVHKDTLMACVAVRRASVGTDR